MSTSNALQIVETIPPGYLPLADVVRELGRSDSTIERKVASGELRWQWSKRSGKKPMKVYLAEDVERLKREEEGRKAARPPSAIAEPRPKPETDALLRAMLAILDRVTKPPAQLAAPAPTVALKDKLWLSLDEAVAYSGLVREDLKKLCRAQFETHNEANGLYVRKSGGWKILRESLEAFHG
jgi:hypothetical protein